MGLTGFNLARRRLAEIERQKQAKSAASQKETETKQTIAENEGTKSPEEGSSVSGEFPKQTGKGVYVLSNGEIVRGKKKAVAAQNKLDK